MKPAVLLDTTPLGLLTQRAGVPQADACRRWLASLQQAGHRVLVPEMADYEVRRELLRAGNTLAVQRLDAFLAADPDAYLPLSTAVMRHAALLWAQARQQGRPTAPDPALDGDVILAAQALSVSAVPGEVVVATANPGHLSRFVAAERWEDIRP